MKKLRIGQISPLNLPVPPKKYGGTEKIIHFLCQELTQRGHKVFLFGSGDSKTKGKLIEIVKKGLWSSRNKNCGALYIYQMAVIAQKAKELNLDIIHDHLGPMSMVLAGQDVPLIHTLHVPFNDKSRIWLYGKLNAKLVSISYKQRKPAPKLNYVANIYNGLDIDNYPFNAKPKNYFAWVGELSPRKGILEAIEIARIAKVNLVIAGRIPPPEQKNDHDFFKKYVEQRLKKRYVKYVGEMTADQLKNVYKNAVAFLNPLQWEEPFGLTTIEAMACGTPVIAFKRGAMPEIIENNKTGFIVKPDEIKLFAGKIKEIHKIKRAECRAWIENNFTKKKMVDQYEKLYFRITQ